MKNNLTLTLVLVIFMSLLSTKGEAQNYKMAAGLRLGYPTSASFKYFLNESNAIEGYIGARGYSGYRWTNISGAYLVHKNLDIVDGLQYYLGAGASVYFWNFDNGFFSNGSSTKTIGLQGYVGLDFTFPNTPISITIDWIPTYFINGFASGFGGAYGTLGVRYILVE